MASSESAFGVLRTAASDLVARSTIARWAGKTFGGNRDPYEALGYKRDLNIDDYRQRWERGGISGTIVDVKPESTWRGEGDLVEDEDPNVTTQFEAAWRALNERLNLWSTFWRADTLSGIGRYAVMVIGAPGSTDAPLDRLDAKAMAYVRPFAEDLAVIEPSDRERDTASPRFGQPNFYNIHAMNLDTRGGTKKVHWTRVVHIPTDGAIEDDLYGSPRLERAWNYLDDLDKVVGGGAESFWVRANQGYAFNLDKDAKLEEPAKAEMREQLDEFIHGMRRMLRLQGVNVKTLGSDVADISNSVQTIISLISAVTRIPQRILLGSERGELASTQDRDNWADRIESRRTQYAHPAIVKPFVQRLFTLKTLPIPKQWHTRWPEMLSLSETEKADLSVKYTTANKNQGEIIITSDEIRDRVYGLPPMAKIDAELDTRQRARRGLPPNPPPASTPEPTPTTASAQLSLLPQLMSTDPPVVNVTTPPVTIHLTVPPTPASPVTAAKTKVLEYDRSGRIARIREEEPAS